MCVGVAGRRSPPAMADLEGRLAAVRGEISGLKTRISAIKEKKNAVLREEDRDVDWEALGKPATVRFDFKTRRVLRGHLGKVYAMQWGSATQLVSASQDGKLIVWNAELEAKVNLVSLKMAWVMTCAYEPSAQELVACGGLDNVCSVYKLKAVGSSIIRPDIELRGHDGYLSCARFVSTSQILTASGDSTCALWDINRREKVKDFTDHGGDVMRCAAGLHPAVWWAVGLVGWVLGVRGSWVACVWGAGSVVPQPPRHARCPHSAVCCMPPTHPPPLPPAWR